jgi:hypothetical protein
MSRLYRFDVFFVEPLSHTILNGLIRPFLLLIFDSDTNKGLVVNGEPFFVPSKVQQRVDSIISQLKRHGSFGRPFSSVSECATHASM